ncbi:hypothetical protein RQP46_007727 [Phenoliferia psychrophenolica]
MSKSWQMEALMLICAILLSHIVYIYSGECLARLRLRLRLRREQLAGSGSAGSTTRTEQEELKIPEDEGTPENRYTIKWERYNMATGMWEPRTDYGTGLKHKSLFTATHRIFPRSPEGLPFAGKFDFTEIQVHSAALVGVLRQELKEATTSEVVDHLTVLLKYIDELFAPTKAKLDRLLKDNVISYALLWAIFSPARETFVAAVDEYTDEVFAFKLKSCHYQTRGDPACVISGTQIVWNGSRFVRTDVAVGIPEFKGMQEIPSLAVYPLTDNGREELTERGRISVSLSRVAFQFYSGNLIQVSGVGHERQIIRLRAEGRAVIDAKGFKNLNPSENIWERGDGFVPLPPASPFEDEGMRPDRKQARFADKVAEDELCLLPPYVLGFSLVLRQWGRMQVDKFSDVVFSEDAYESLVLNPSHKDLIKSLVAQNSKIARKKAEKPEDKDAQNSVEDLVAGKGGGFVMVLHGNPGTGKTLTAEATAELLQVPLYAIGAGELGVHADELERRLRDALDVGLSWGAVVLIDEADVFLEERGVRDVYRNSMVSVFLRLLEYHSGILILTTNRIRTVDPAFLSRFSLALTYPDLDETKRTTIWSTFLKRAGARIEEGTKPPRDASGAISAAFLNQLSQKPFNGRSIKNVVRTAAALAQSKGVPLSEEHLSTVGTHWF